MSLGSDTNAFFNAEIERYIAAGLVIVAAAGNDNDDACNYSPASATSAIAVGATTKNDARWTDFKSSNFGSCVDVWAPGAEIKSANFSNVNGYSLMNGTSMAAPRKFILVL
jgi:subtilisin family serine protease